MGDIALALRRDDGIPCMVGTQASMKRGGGGLAKRVSVRWTVVGAVTHCVECPQITRRPPRKRNNDRQ